MSPRYQRIRDVDAQIVALENRCVDAIARFEVDGGNLWPALRLRLGYERLAPLEKGRPARRDALLDPERLYAHAEHFRGRVAFVTGSAAYRLGDDGSGVNERLQTAIRALPDDSAVVLGNLRAEEENAHRAGKLAPPLDLPLDALLPASRATRALAGPRAAAYALGWQRGLRETGITFGDAARTVARVLTEAAIWERLLARLEPRHVVVMISSYGFEGLQLACKRRQIPVSEYQHAVIYPEHVGYNYAASLGALRGRFVVPDSLLLYGPFWRDMLLARKFYDARDLVVTGHPTLVQPGTRDPLRSDARRRVLVCTSMADSRMFAELVAAYLRESPHAGTVRFVVKQHPREPGELRALWSRAASDFPEAVELSNLSTYTEMERCDVQLTGQSSTLYEGVHFGLFTYAVPDPAYGFVESSIWPREGVEIVERSYRGPFEARPLSARQIELSARMWRPFDAEAFRAHVLGAQAL